jgi:hypothetical protein
MHSAFNVPFSKSWINYSHWVDVDVVFFKNQNTKKQKNNNIETKGPQWKGRKQGTKVNLGCLLDQAIKEEDKTF